MKKDKFLKKEMEDVFNVIKPDLQELSDYQFQFQED